MEFINRVEKAGYSVREKAVKNKATNQWFRASTPKVDRYGEIVIPTGIKMNEYMQNPIFGWGHNVYGGVPKENFIGKIVDYEMSGEALDVEVEFIPDAGKNSDGSGYSFLDMVKGGFLNAVSIGFRGLAWHDEELQGIGPVRIWDETELMEISLVGIPANPESVRKSLEFGFENEILKDYSRAEAPSKDADTAAAIEEAFKLYKIKHAFNGK